MKHSVLLVDDEPNVTIGLRRALRKEPYEILIAHSGDEALEILEGIAINAIVVDQNMPGMKGTDLLKQVRRSYPHTARYMLTGNATPEVAISAINDGAISRFFAKPCDLVDLKATLRQGLQNKDILAEAKGLSKEVRRLEAIVATPDEHELLMERKRLRPSQPVHEQNLTEGENDSLDSAPISQIALPEDVLRTVEIWHGLLKDWLFCPVGIQQERLLIAVTNPRDVIAEDNARILFSGWELAFQAATPEKIIMGIDRLLATEVQSQSAMDVARHIEVITADEIATEDSEEEALLEANENENTTIKLVNAIIEDALKEGASDIHVESVIGGDMQVRLRVDGILQNHIVLPRYLCKAIISRLKIMAGLDIADHRKPQSGKIHFRRPGKTDFELRVETYPIAGGAEHAVMRLLLGAKGGSLSTLGMTKRNLSALEGIIQRPYGLFLCVGPTGCGKTTTLHSVLANLNDGSRKILTIEDPVEITQPGLCQMQVNLKTGLTFAGAFRSVLRADPDVIMVGEMRDLETATVAVQAGLTGHLVFSTFHTNNAPETMTRLLYMGLDPYTFSDTLLGVLAQRLVRVLCPECRTPLLNGEEVFGELQAENGDLHCFGDFERDVKPTLYEPREGGCDKCHGTGYRGRTAIHELSSVDDELRVLIASRSSTEEIRKCSMRSGMSTLKHDGIEKVLVGLTSIREVRRVCSR